MKRLLNRIFPRNQWDAPTRQYAIALFLKFILFDVIWCLQTTFTSFSMPELYVNTALATLVLLLPYIVTRRDWVQLAVLFVVDALLVCNLMYSRTYNSVIPLSSYGLAGNLSDFLPSVIDSMRWIDLLFPLSTVGLLIHRLRRRHPMSKRRRVIMPYAVLTLVVAGISAVQLAVKGGLTKAFDHLQSANYYTCIVPMYTIFGHLYYDAIQTDRPFTPEMKRKIEHWMVEKPAYRPLSDSISRRTNLVVVLCESLESWVLERQVEGIEITPNLNRILRESSTLYAPHVLTQVKGGRSIDCQLLLNAGMLPVNSGCYAMRYPDDTFLTLTKALHAREKSRSYLLTVDKAVTWNQAIVARSFGIDTLLAKPCWRLDEKVGSRKKLGDVSFMKQAVEKMRQGEIWKSGEHVYLQFVTYSGHNPFVLPDALKRIKLHGNYPVKMRDYITMANYTDHALGILLNYLKTRPDYKNTMIVITGDHEGLAADREDIRRSAIGRKMVSSHLHTPFIVVNSPVGVRYDAVMGQVDMYPTILNLLHLDDYAWKGIGQSILDPSKAPAAVGSDMQVEVSGQGVSPQEIERLKQAHTVSDLMIRYDWLKNK
ncbi:LTA synthase family protein [Hoylesella enoeca]|uniref:LTA synthase family protein n=1 Tax=Hoylesella enoeca TaxID=76123 RepID=UPI0028898C68|nr:LTA synthase family protein [Hoylesella enoeca]